MAKKKIEELTRVELIENHLNEGLLLAKAEYEVKPSTELYSVIVDMELTIKEIKKLK
jgi:hypothetical protein